MQAKIQRWGNSLAVRIPKALAADAHLHEASMVDVKLVDGQIVISPTARPVYTLAELLAGVTDENLHAEVPIGPSVGAEEW